MAGQITYSGWCPRAREGIGHREKGVDCSVPGEVNNDRCGTLPNISSHMQLTSISFLKHIGINQN